MSDYRERKAERVAEFEKNKGRKFVTCGACNGSGRYDHNGSPPCSSCSGKGRVREPLPPVAGPPQPENWRDTLKAKESLQKARMAPG